jgi:DNA-directed RNA polymerase subunit RPC12/RpoP
MNCPKCSSKMIMEKNYTESETWFGWRCIKCGEIIDPLILENRRISRPRYREVHRNKPSRVTMWEIG